MAIPSGRQLSVAHQALRLRLRFPNERYPVVKSGRLVWRLNLQPTPLSVVYQVEVRYRHRDTPRVRVLSPKLESRPGETLPHVYPGNELCLYYRREFVGSRDFIADTIVPWTSEWLYFYEYWMSTGVWLGSEAPHFPGAATI